MIPSGFFCQRELRLKRQRKQALTSQKLPLAKSISPLKLMVYHLILSGVSANACNVSPEMHMSLSFSAKGENKDLLQELIKDTVMHCKRPL